MALVGTLIIGNWTVLCVFNYFFLLIKTCFLTNLNTDLYHISKTLSKKIISLTLYAKLIIIKNSYLHLHPIYSWKIAINVFLFLFFSWPIFFVHECILKRSSIIPNQLLTFVFPTQHPKKGYNRHQTSYRLNFNRISITNLSLSNTTSQERLQRTSNIVSSQFQSYINY